MVNSIYSKNLPSHENPIPHAAKVNNLIMSSAISGKDKNTGLYSPEKESQIKIAFKYFRELLASCNCSPQDVIKIDMFFQDKNDRTLVNKFWEETYPNINLRPARHSHQSALPKGCIFQITFTALKKD